MSEKRTHVCGVRTCCSTLMYKPAGTKATLPVKERARGHWKETGRRCIGNTLDEWERRGRGVRSKQRSCNCVKLLGNSAVWIFQNNKV